jgi:hypothetical protein
MTGEAAEWTIDIGPLGLSGGRLQRLSRPGAEQLPAQQV